MAKKSITGGALQEGLAEVEKLRAEWVKNRGLVSDYVPAVRDQATYDKLVKAVQDAAACNESMVAFQSRCEGLGSAVLSLAKTVGLIAA
jgi:hypothetical protein